MIPTRNRIFKIPQAARDFLRKALVGGLVLPSFAFASLGMQGLLVAQAAESPGTTCTSVTLTSGDATGKTAGYTETNPLAAPVSLQTSAYSGAAWNAAVPTQPVIPPWIDPSTDPNFSGSGAVWVSSSSTWPGGTGNSEGSPTNNQWRLFEDSFSLPGNAMVQSASLYFTGDNAVDVYLNGNSTPVATTNSSTSTDDVYGSSTSGTLNFEQVFTAPFTPAPGSNTLDFVLRNWSADKSSNPTGLLYKAVVSYCVPNPTTVQVHIEKFIDGNMATATTANSNSFPFTATWNATNIGSGSGQYSLGPTGFNSSTPYEAVTAAMTSGASYSTSEMTDNAVVGASCNGTTTPFALVGYSTGGSLAAAEAATPTSTPPSLTNITSDQWIIAWNKDCSNNSGSIGGNVTGGQSGNGTLQVTSVTPVKTTGTADGSFADGWKYIFNITVPSDEPKLSMKFGDWMSLVGSSTLPAANNIRISSAQADNGGATVLITAADTYSSPALNMVGDLDSTTVGKQVQVTVEVAIPSSTVNGSYVTTYGVKTTP